MDFTSTVRTETLSATASVLVPGLAAVTPYAAYLAAGYPTIGAFAAAHEAQAVTVMVFLTVGGGFLIESLGSYIEFHILDRRHPDRTAMLAEWRRYLQIAWKVEPIGQHYLRRLLTTFKFELNLLTAAIVAFPGVVLLFGAGLVSPGAGWALIGVSVALGWYLLQAATATSLLLADTRKLLLESSAARSLADVTAPA